MNTTVNYKRSTMQNAVTLITGAGGGLGRATALTLVAEGAKVGITDLKADGLAETAEMIKAISGQAVSVVGNIVDPGTIDTLTSRVVQAYGYIDGLVNNAGIVLVKPILEHTLEDFNKVLHINTWSHLLAAKRVVPEMQKIGRGAIVNVASVGAKLAINELGVYCASKAAVLGMTRVMAVELAPNIRVNALCPGGIDTPMAAEHFSHFPSREAALEVMSAAQIQKRYADPLELAKAVLFLVGDDSSFMTGQDVSVDGGWTTQ